MVVSREPAVRPQRKRLGFAAKELEQTQYGVSVVKGGATRDVRVQKSGDVMEITLDVQRV